MLLSVRRFLRAIASLLGRRRKRVEQGSPQATAAGSAISAGAKQSEYGPEPIAAAAAPINGLDTTLLQTPAVVAVSDENLGSVTASAAPSIIDSPRAEEAPRSPSTTSEELSTAPATPAPDKSLGDDKPIEVPHAANTTVAAVPAAVEAPAAAPEVEAAKANFEIASDLDQVLPWIDSRDLPEPFAENRKEGTKDDTPTAAEPVVPAPSSAEVREVDGAALLDSPERKISRVSAPGRVRQPAPPRIRREPSSFAQPYGGASPDLPADYREWNKAIVDRFLIDVASDDVFLTITPRILDDIYATLSNAPAVAEASEEAFAAAVKRAYATVTASRGSGLELLRRFGDDGLPACVAFLSASVLAAYRMHTDEEAAANAYYTRFDEILGCGITSVSLRGFDPEEYEGLWHFVAAWVLHRHGKRLVLPSLDGVQRRYVSLPLAHVPLRKVDIDRLPTFFSWAGYEACEKVALSRLEGDLRRWLELQLTLTAPAILAFRDQRRASVLAQVAQELASWDGSDIDVQGRRSAPVEILLQWSRQVPSLSFLARRPAAFPDSFADGLHVLEAGIEGWYEPVSITPSDGPALQSGFEWQDATVTFHRRAASAIAFVPCEFSGFLSHPGLLLGAKCAVLCRDDLQEKTRSYLETITGTVCLPFNGRDLPSGWKLFTGVSPSKRTIPPPELSSLDVLPDTQIIFQGGLRLGRRSAWLKGGTPDVIVAGHDVKDTVLVDGIPSSLGADSRLVAPGVFDRVGTHVIEIGRVRRTIEIVEAQVTVKLAEEESAGPTLTPVALPPGDWVLIGSKPHEIQKVVGTHWQAGTLTHCPFPPAWAVTPESREGAVAFRLRSTLPSPLQRGRSFDQKSNRVFRSWADTIFRTNMRRPSIGSFDPADELPPLRTEWAAYCNAARDIRRRLKKKAP